AYDEALARVDAVAATSLGRFVTPSGNIYCVIEADAPARGCEIAAGGSRDVTACGGDAPTPVVGRVELQDAGAVAVCNTDTIRQPDPPVLAYGRAARVGGGDVRCLSEPSGVTCVSDTAGFVLRRGAYALLNP
ncbi:MAG: hypothetical protein LH468_02925, partial [Nocardioides sp.]|nr:hypothetical protein [Nocardioides sp.]